MNEIVFNVARDIPCGAELHRTRRGQPDDHLDTAIAAFASELRDRFNNPTTYDPVETIALIEYRFRYIGPFFGSTDRRISDAIGRFLVMHRDGLKLPREGSGSISGWDVEAAARARSWPEH
jgi:hypothetical protein